MFFFTVLIDLRSIEMFLKCPEVHSNDDTWIRLKFFFMQKKITTRKWLTLLCSSKFGEWIATVKS